MENAINYTEAFIGNSELQVPQYKIPDYDPENIELILDNPPPELIGMRRDLSKFLKNNAKYWSIHSLAKFLGTSTATLSKLVYLPDFKLFNTQKAQTILILKPRASLEVDAIAYSVGKI